MSLRAMVRLTALACATNPASARAGKTKGVGRSLNEYVRDKVCLYALEIRSPAMEQICFLFGCQCVEMNSAGVSLPVGD